MYVSVFPENISLVKVESCLHWSRPLLMSTHSIHSDMWLVQILLPLHLSGFQLAHFVSRVKVYTHLEEYL